MIHFFKYIFYQFIPFLFFVHLVCLCLTSVAIYYCMHVLPVP